MMRAYRTIYDKKIKNLFQEIRQTNKTKKSIVYISLIISF